jgi:ribosomal protein S18 acetylase RimI-like enzyme
MEVSIRRAVKADGTALTALDTAVWSPGVTPSPPPQPDRDFFPEGDDPGSTLVAVVDGGLAGYVTLAAGHLESSRHVLEVSGLAVEPSLHRHGVGRRLVEAAADEARDRKARRLTLRVLAPNRPARALYEACGFEVEGILRGEFWLGGRYVDDVLMALDLTKGTKLMDGARS